MKRLKDPHARLDLASKLTMAVTAILFIIALFEKGLTQEVLLEAGVFLVSVKLVLASHKTEIGIREIKEELARLSRPPK